VPWRQEAYDRYDAAHPAETLMRELSTMGDGERDWARSAYESAGGGGGDAVSDLFDSMFGADEGDMQICPTRAFDPMPEVCPVAPGVQSSSGEGGGLGGWMASAGGAMMSGLSAIGSLFGF